MRAAMTAPAGGAADAKNLFVGVGGMGDLPGFLAVGGGYGGGLGSNGAGVTGPLGGLRGSSGIPCSVGGAGGIPFGGFAGRGAPFGGVGSGYSGGVAGAGTP